MEAFRTHSNPLLYPDTDWMKVLFESTSPQTQANLNISGGTDRVRYFVSMGMLDQKVSLKIMTHVMMVTLIITAIIIVPIWTSISLKPLC